MKLSEKQKEVILVLRNGGKIYKTHSGKPGNVGTYSIWKYTDGKGNGGTFSEATRNALIKMKILNVFADDYFRTQFKLTKLGKTIEL